LSSLEVSRNPKSLNSFSLSSCFIPIPESYTRICSIPWPTDFAKNGKWSLWWRCSGSFIKVHSTKTNPPLEVNLSALESKFKITCYILYWSEHTL
jgi:hypothetical protein